MKTDLVFLFIIILLFSSAALAGPVEITIDYGNETCAESWSCVGWGPCSEGAQTRNCTDANGCGTTISKPPESQSCTGSCTENWSCPDWSAISCLNNVQTRTCTDSNNCGTTANKSAESQSCSSGQQGGGSNFGGGTSSGTPTVKVGNKTVTQPKPNIPAEPEMKKSDYLKMEMTAPDEAEAGEPIPVVVSLNSSNDLSTTVELLGEKQDVSLVKNVMKTINFIVHTPEKNGAYNLVAVTPIATANKAINLIYKPLFLYTRKIDDNTYEIHLKCFEDKTTTELDVIKNNVETAYLDSMNGVIDYSVNISLPTPAEYTVKAKTLSGSAILDEDIRIIRIEGKPETSFGMIVLAVVVIVILIVPIILFKGKKVS